MSPKKIIFFLAVTLMVIINTSGCFPKESAKPNIQPKIKVGLILAETETENNKYLLEKFKEEAEKEKIRLISAQAEKKSEQQKIEIEKMIEKGVQAVIIQPVETLFINDYLSMLQEKNIKIILMDALPKDIAVEGFIAADYLKAGELQAQKLLKTSSELNVLILKGDESNNITDKLLQGNMNILKDNPQVKNYVVKEIIDWDENFAYEIISQIFSNNNTAFNGIIAHSETIASGAYKGLKDMGLNQNIFISTIGISQEYVNDIAAGQIFAVDTMPGLTAQIALKAAIDLISDNNWEYDLQLDSNTALIPSKLTPLRIIDKDNLFLLKERFKNLPLQETEDNKTKEESNQKSDSAKENKVKIKTKEGEEFNIIIPGEIEELEMIPEENNNGKKE